MKKFESAITKIYYYLRDKKGHIPEKVVYRNLVLKEPRDLPNKYVKFFMDLGKLADLRLGVILNHHESGYSYLTIDVVGYEVNVNQFCKIFYGLLEYEPEYKKGIRKEAKSFKRRLLFMGDPRIKEVPHTNRIASQYFQIEMYYLKLLVKNLLANKKRLPLSHILKHKQVKIKEYIYNNRIKSKKLTIKYYEQFKTYLNKD